MSTARIILASCGSGAVKFDLHQKSNVLPQKYGFTRMFAVGPSRHYVPVAFNSAARIGVLCTRRTVSRLHFCIAAFFASVASGIPPMVGRVGESQDSPEPGPGTPILLGSATPIGVGVAEVITARPGVSAMHAPQGTPAPPVCRRRPQSSNTTCTARAVCLPDQGNRSTEAAIRAGREYPPRRVLAPVALRPACATRSTAAASAAVFATLMLGVCNV